MTGPTVTGPTAERVLEIAQGLAQTRGFNGFSYRDLAAALGIKSASVHYHFPTKADLGVALVQRYRADFARALRDIDDRHGTAARRLKAFVALFGETLTQERYCLCGMLGAERDSLPAEVNAEVRGFFGFLESWLAETLKQGRQVGALDFKGTPQAAAGQLLALLEGAMLLARSFGEPERFDKTAACHLRGLTI